MSSADPLIGRTISHYRIIEKLGSSGMGVAEILPDKRYADDRIALIHDRSEYDAILLEAFNHLKSDEALPNRERFTTITSMGWEDCVPLQPADMIAYSNFKTVERGQKKRKDFELILDLDSIGGRGVFLKRQAFREIREKLDTESKTTLFKNARISPRKHRRRNH